MSSGRQPGLRRVLARPAGQGSWGWALWLGMGVLSGCASWGSQPQSTTFAGGAQKRAELSCPRESSERVDVGSWRGTGRPDVARVFTRGSGGQPTVLACREVDLNGDGRKDMLVFYLPDGRKQREEFDHDYDGVPDVKSYYEAGVLVRQELDVNFDGKPDLLQHFENGRLTRTERLWESKPDAEPPPSKPESSGEATAESKAPPTPVSSNASPSSPPPLADSAGSKSPPALLPADSTPRSITPTLPAPPALPEPASAAPPR